MTRWQELPDELDPQVREFTEQLRRVVERSRLPVDTVADRTGYGRSSWERYLGGRLLPPQGAVEALAEVTGAEPGHLVAMWELAERAWSRAERRPDPAPPAAEARASLGEFGPPPDLSPHRRRFPLFGRGGADAPGASDGVAEDGAGPDAPASDAVRDDAPPEVVPPSDAEPADAAADGGAPVYAGPEDVEPAGVEPEDVEPEDVEPEDVEPEDVEPAGMEPEDVEPADAEPEDSVPVPVPAVVTVADVVTQDPGPVPDAERSASPWEAEPAPGVSAAPEPAGGRANLAKPLRAAVPPSVTEPDRAVVPPDATEPDRAAGPDGPTAAPAPPVVPAQPGPPEGPGAPEAPASTGDGEGENGNGAKGRRPRLRRAVGFTAVLAAVLALGAGIVYGVGLVGGDGDEGSRDEATPSPSVSPSRTLPAGITCQGSGCTGKDPENSGCGGENAETTDDLFLGGAYVEVRFSKLCGAVWGRVTDAATGSVVRLEAGAGRVRQITVDRSGEGYTPMEAVESPAGIRTCVELADGRKGCTGDAG
ncbi:DUF2690 domain-containing protein [Streptomyces sp. NPDC051940]|uniref:helix-turn-helix domain-containing protein n=1 Tax=Streptomyces sp. NPDC051940 TaxID=3155675 RepID=UPI00343C65EC